MPVTRKRIGKSAKHRNVSKFMFTYTDGSTGIRWMARLTFPRASDGSQPRDMDFWGNSEREAVEKRRAISHEAETARANGVTLDTQLKGLAKFLVDEYLPELTLRMERGEEKHSRSSISSKIGRFHNYFLTPKERLPKALSLPLRTLPITKLKPEHFDAYFQLLLMTGISDGVRMKIRHDWLKVLNRVRRQLPEPISEYMTSEQCKVEMRPRRRKLTFDADKIYAGLLNRSIDPMYRAAFGMLFDSLRRPSELWALEWADVDFEKSQVSFTKTMRLSAKGGREIAPPKSGMRSARVLPMASYVMTALKDLRDKRPKARYIFETAKRCQMNNEKWRRRFFPLAIEAFGLTYDGPMPTFYSMKHVGNSWQDANGMPLLTRVFKAGHVDARMLTTAYDATTAKQASQAQAAFEARLRDAVASSEG